MCCLFVLVESIGAIKQHNRSFSTTAAVIQISEIKVAMLELHFCFQLRDVVQNNTADRLVNWHNAVQVRKTKILTASTRIESVIH